MKKRYNLKDIAKIAGVGIGTASRVINNKKGVKEETRKRVLKIIDELDYVPNSVARTLKQNSSKLIGIIIKGKFNPFFGEVIEAIEIIATKAGYGTLLHYTDTIETSSFKYLLDRKIEGLIYLGGYFDKEIAKEVAKLKVPVVAASTVLVEGVDKDGFSSVTIDNMESAYKIIDMLCEKGHKHIGFIGSDEGDYNYLERRKGYIRALEKHNLEFREEYLLAKGDYTFESGYSGAKELIEKNKKLTAIFAISDMMAIGAARAILEKGYRIPDDISLVGFDGLENSKYYYPSISTMEQPKHNLGAESAKLLFERIEDDEKGKIHIVLNTNFIERESVKDIKKS